LTEEKGGYLLRGDRFVVKAMKMYSDDGTVIFKEQWCAEGGGKWLTAEIPEGLEIIGL